MRSTHLSCVMSAAAGVAALSLGASAASAHPWCGSNYCTNAQIGAFLLDIETNYPSIARRHVIGYSELGREMWAIHISDNPDIEEDEPEFRYISTLHGDEVVGVETCMYLADLLTSDYGSDARITELVDELDIWIMPLANPDGYVAITRYNDSGFDLNRSFPDIYTDPVNTTAGRPAEVAALMDWAFASSFAASANFHGGEKVVNYPFDNNPTGTSGVYTATPDDDVMVYISEEYSRTNLPMWNSASFFHGITNGTDWYAIDGGLQDWSYNYMGCTDLTIELYETKRPSYSLIPSLWNDNRDSMLNYLETCRIGVRGLVTEAGSGDPLAATVRVVGRDHDIYTDPDVGDYHRMLLPGTYDLAFTADGYEPLTVTGVVVSQGLATRLDVQLELPPELLSPNGGEAFPQNTPTTVMWSGSASNAFQVQYTDNFGETGPVNDDFERTTLGGDYTTGGDQDWLTTTAASHSGSRSARAGSITHNQTSWMEREVSGGGVSFWYRVSSESSYDFFNFYVDGTRVIHVSGSGSWTQYSTNLASGTHTLRWEYTKDVSVSSGSDTVWIDDLALVSDLTTWTDIVAQTAVGASSASWTPTTLGDAYKVRLRTIYGAGAYGNWDESDAVFSVVSAPEPCVGDLDGDNDVDSTDLATMLGNFGLISGALPEEGDLDGDGDIDSTDLAALLGNFGTVCP